MFHPPNPYPVAVLSPMGSNTVGVHRLCTSRLLFRLVPASRSHVDTAIAAGDSLIITGRRPGIRTSPRAYRRISSIQGDGGRSPRSPASCGVRAHTRCIAYEGASRRTASTRLCSRRNYRGVSAQFAFQSPGGTGGARCGPCPLALLAFRATATAAAIRRRRKQRALQPNPAACFKLRTEVYGSLCRIDGVLDCVLPFDDSNRQNKASFTAAAPPRT